MYHRHSTSSTGGAPPQHHQQPYSFQRAQSVGARPQSQFRRSFENSSNHANSSHFNPNVSDTSYSSLPNYGKRNSFSNAQESSEYDTKYRKRSNNAGSMSLESFLLWRVLPCLVLILLPWVPTHFARRQVRSKKLAIDFIIQDQKELVEKLDDRTAKIKELKLDLESLHRDNELSFQELKMNGKSPENLAAGDKGVTGETTVTNMESDEYASLEEEEHVLLQRIDRLEKSIQKRSAKRIIQRYGNGQYRFKVNVRDQRGTLRFFVIETAMLSEMPHAIDHFHRMVENKLWDGLSLIHEPDSQIISATPEMADESHAWAGKRFVDANLTHMAFTEHSPTYPPPHHRKFTVAFSGRPGGPGFYISLENELVYSHEHESTFAVVMEGRDVLYQLFLQKDRGRQRILTIESINILPPKRPTKNS